MKISLFSLLLLILSLSVYSQDKLISRQQINLNTNDSLLFYDITYLSDSLRIKGFIVEPANTDNILPVIIFNRGGNRDFGMIDSNTLQEWIAPIARAGYIVVASQYRGSTGSDGKDEFGGDDVNDVLNLIPLLTEILHCDTSKVGMYGWSRGGMMTYITLAKTNKIKAAVVGDAPTDMIKLLEERPQFEKTYRELIPNYDSSKIKELQRRSAINWVEKISPATPLLIIHGKKDERVNFDQAQQLSNKLISLGHIHRLVLFDADHIISQDRERKDKEIIEWFDKYLK